MTRIRDSNQRLDEREAKPGRGRLTPSGAAGQVRRRALRGLRHPSRGSLPGARRRLRRHLPGARPARPARDDYDRLRVPCPLSVALACPGTPVRTALSESGRLSRRGRARAPTARLPARRSRWHRRCGAGSESPPAVIGDVPVQCRCTAASKSSQGAGSDCPRLILSAQPISRLHADCSRL